MKRWRQLCGYKAGESVQVCEHKASVTIPWLKSIWYFKGRTSVDGADCMGVGDRVCQPSQTEINTSLEAQCC